MNGHVTAKGSVADGLRSCEHVTMANRRHKDAVVSDAAYLPPTTTQQLHTSGGDRAGAPQQWTLVTFHGSSQASVTPSRRKSLSRVEDHCKTDASSSTITGGKPQPNATLLLNAKNSTAGERSLVASTKYRESLAHGRTDQRLGVSAEVQV